MNYDNILKMLFKKIPKIEKIYNERKEENLVDENTGKHIVFGLIIVPYIIEEVNKSEDQDLVIKMFEFLEEMSFCEDVKVKEVLDFTVLEQFIDEGKQQLDILKKYMHENVLSSCLEIEKYFILKWKYYYVLNQLDYLVLKNKNTQ